MQFADRLNNVETSAIRELFKLLGKPGIISFAGGFPDSAMFDVEGIRAASNAALTEEPGAALQYGATEGYNPLREQLAAFMTAKGAKEVAAGNLIVTTGSQQALDLLGKTLISPGDKVIVEGPTFLATIQCFRLYGAELISAPIDGNGVKTDELEKLIAEHQPKFVYLIPTFGNPSGAMLSLERRKAVLEMAVKHNTLIVEMSCSTPRSSRRATPRSSRRSTTCRRPADNDLPRRPRTRGDDRRSIYTNTHRGG